MSTAASLQNLAVQPKALSNSTQPGLLLQRKCACGSPTSSLTGECAECKSRKRLQTKLAIDASNDPLEQEADRVADQVLEGPSNPAVSGAPPHIQRFTGQAPGQADTAPASVDRALASPGSPLGPAMRQDMEQRFGHDFSKVRVHSDGAAEQSARIFMDGPEKGTTPKPAAPQPVPKPKTPPAQAASCPTDVQVINIDPLTDSQFGKNGMLTGIGAVAYMEVSGSGGKDWDGTIVQETVKQTKNTCGDRARKVCSNESGESGGFKVGAETNLLGKAKMPALRNTFYDLHVFTREVSILHELGKSECEIQCQQSYQCGGKQFGPEFIVTYMTKKDTIAKTYDVTRITVKKEAKATPAAAPANP